MHLCVQAGAPVLRRVEAQHAVVLAQERRAPAVRRAQVQAHVRRWRAAVRAQLGLDRLHGHLRGGSPLQHAQAAVRCPGQGTLVLFEGTQSSCFLKSPMLLPAAPATGAESLGQLLVKHAFVKHCLPLTDRHPLLYS